MWSPYPPHYQLVQKSWGAPGPGVGSLWVGTTTLAMGLSRQVHHSWLGHAAAAGVAWGWQGRHTVISGGRSQDGGWQPQRIIYIYIGRIPAPHCPPAGNNQPHSQSHTFITVWHQRFAAHRLGGAVLRPSSKKPPKTPQSRCPGSQEVNSSSLNSGKPSRCTHYHQPWLGGSKVKGGEG